MKKCIGCGAILQNSNENEIGYVVDLEKDYCQRCFKMNHYDYHDDDDFMANNDETIKQLKKLQGNFVWIIDIFDLESSLNSILTKLYQDNTCSIILNKCDLLPASTNFVNLQNYILKRINKLNIKCNAIITRGVNEDFVDIFDKYINNNEPIIMTGLANVGKSTIINHLLGKSIVTTNRYPATTININEIITGKYHIFDTVGIVDYKSIVLYLNSKQLKTVLPTKQIRERILQLSGQQSIAIGGLARIDFDIKNNCQCVIYCSNQLEIHRGKKDNANKLWQNNYGGLLVPAIENNIGFEDFKKLSFTNINKKEYYINGLGFIKVIGNCKIDIFVDNRINVQAREAML